MNIFTKYLNKKRNNKSILIISLLFLLSVFAPANLFAAAPKANFNVDGGTDVVSKKVGEYVTFTDASTNTNSRKWDFGIDASLPPSEDVGPHKVSYSTPGFKEVTLIAIKGTDSDTKSEKVVKVFATYYYRSGNPSSKNSWKTTRSGQGNSPANFSSGYQTFVIQSGQNCTTTAAWPLTGAETKIVIEENASLIAPHTIGDTSSDISLELESGATYEHNHNTAHIWSGSAIAAPTSTISYGYAGDQNIAAIDYGNLKVSAGGDKILLGDVTVSSSLNLSGAKIVLGNHDLTVNKGASIVAGEGYSLSNMVVTQGTGSFIKEGSVSADFKGVYPVGSGGKYTPFQITDMESVGEGSISVRTVSEIAPGSNPTDLERHWVTEEAGVNVQSASVRFTYSGDELPNPISYEPKVFQNGSWVDISGGQNFGGNTFGGVGISDLTGIWTLREPVVTYYSYQSGSWNSANTWTTDPSGTLSVNPGVPSPKQRVIILNGRNVTIPDNTKEITSLIIQEGGLLDLGTTTGHSFGDVSGEGTLRLQTNSFPAGSFAAFTSVGGGTVEYYNPSASFTIQQLEYNNLTFNFSNASHTATLANNLTVNGDLNVRRGQFQIGNNTTGRTVQINGNVLVDNNGRIQLGTGNANHRFIVKGDFTNYGVVRFTNQDTPNYTGTPNNGRADVVFNNPSADQNLYMTGQSDFYRIEIDKGVDQTFVLNIDAKDVGNFRLFGRNNVAADDNTASFDNPHALGLQAGTVRLGQNIVIPSLASGVTYSVDEDAMLWLDGANVTFGTGNTADGTTLLLYGALKVSGNSVFNDNSKQGIVSRATASIIIEGGEIYTECVRPSYQEGVHRGAFNMSGGELTVRAVSLPNLTGMNRYPAFSVPYAENTINISGGSINILSPNILNGGSGTNFSLLIGVNPDNASITGGEINVTVPSGRDAYMLSTTPVWDLNIISTSRNNAAQPSAYTNNASIRGVSIQPLVVKNNLTLINRAVLSSGNDNANIIVGGDFIINSNSTYTPGTNTTIFNGAGPQNFTNSGTLTSGFNHLELAGKSDVTLNGTNTVVAVRGNMTLGKETILRDNGRTITVAGNISNSGTHFRPVSGAGRIELIGNVAQTLSGDGSGVFNNLSLNKGGGVVNMESAMTITGDLRLVNNHRLVIGNHPLKLGAFSNVYSAATGTAQTFTNNKMIVTGGLMSNGGVQKQFSNTDAFLYPFGFAIGTAYYYMPATIKFGAAPTQWGAVTSRPVNGRHHLAQGTNNALTAYWKTTSTGFSGIPASSVVHTYKYLQNFVPVPANESSYIPAVYGYGTSWRTINDVNLVNQATDVITFNAESNANGDYTAGLPTAFAGIPVLYSRSTGDWSEANTWSTTDHTGTAGTVTPTANTIVVIGDGHTVTMTGNGAAAGALFISDGGTLDLVRTNGHNFAALPEETVAGSGTMRIASSYFPRGDFGEFLGKDGGTVEYYVSGGNAYTMPVISDGTAIPLTNYRKLIVNASGAIITLPAVSFTVYDDLVVRGVTQVLTNTASENSYFINRDLILEGGTLVYQNRRATHFVVHRDVNINVGSNFIVNNAGTTVSNTLQIYGNLINNGTFNMVGGSRNTSTFFKGENGADIEGSGSTFHFYNLFVDKGSDAASVLTLKSKITTGVTNPFLTLLNGTFRVDKEDLIVTVTDGTTDFTIPSTAALSVRSGTVRVAYGNNNANLLLSGKLEVLGGKMEIGESTRNQNNSIEYAAAGKPEVFVSGGELYVNGQIRRPSTTTSGSLNYIQSGGEVLIAGRNRMTSRAMIEVANSGSLFNMSGGTLILARPSADGTTFGDLYLRPQEHVVSGGIVQLGAENNDSYSYSVQASAPIWDLSVGVNTAQTASLAVLPLVVKNNLSIGNSSVFLANGLGVDIAGSLINNNISSNRGLSNGGFQPGSSSQVTRFNGTGSQFIRGVGTNVTNFANLEVRSNSLMLASSSSVSVNNDLSIFSGKLNDGGNIIAVSNNIYNVGTHVSSSINGGISIEGTQAQSISGNNAVFGNVLMNNSNGANVMSNIRINGQLTFNAGSIYINDYLLTFGENASIGGIPSNKQMLMLNGVLSDLGVRKLFAAGETPEFVFPIGVQGKYTPAAFTVEANGAPGTITLRPINEKHAAVFDPSVNELAYYWSVKSEGFSGLSAKHKYTYVQDDVMPVDDDVSYVGGRYDYENYIWHNLGNVVEASENTVSFTGGYITGEYTAGHATNFVTKPVLYSRTNGDWNSGDTWSLTRGGGASGLTPDGNPVEIAAGHAVTLNVNNAYTYSVKVEGTLDIGTTLYHNMGHFSGSGKMSITSTSDGIFVLPGGRFDDFFDNPNSTLEFKGNNPANLPVKPGNLYKPYQNVILSGTGQKNIGAENMKITGNLTIRNGAVLNNSNYNRILYVGGDWINENTTTTGFIAGRGTVVFDGKNVQSFNVKRPELFYNITMNSSGVLDMNQSADGASMQVSNKLTLTRGVIKSYENKVVHITNTATNAVAGGNSNSYVDGPLTKRILTGQSFTFPVGNGVRYGRMAVQNTLGGASPADWSAQYFSNNLYPIEESNLNVPITSVSNNEHWTLSRPVGASANIQLRWDDSSYPGATSDATLRNSLRVVQYNNLDKKWTERGQSVSASSKTVSTSNRVTTNDYIFTLGLSGVTASITDFTNVEICNNDAVASIPVTLTGSAPWTLKYKVTGAVTHSFEQTGITSPNYIIQLSGADLAGAGDYHVSLVSVSDKSTAGIANAGSVNLTVLPTFVPVVNGAAMVGQNETRAYSTPQNGGNTYSWSWDGTSGGSIATPNSASTDIKFGTINGTFQLQVVETTAGSGCQVSTVFAVEVTNIPVPDIDPKKPNICIGETITYSTAAIAGNQYKWSVTGGTIQPANATNWRNVASGGNTIIVQWNTAGSGTIKVEERIGTGTVKGETIESVVISPAISDRTVSSEDAKVCNGSGTFIRVANSELNVSYRLKNLATNTYIGSSMGGTGSDLLLPTGDLLYAQSSYNIAVVASNLACELELTTKPKITVKPSPVVTLTSDAEGDLFCVGTQVAFEATTGLSNYTFSVGGLDVPSASNLFTSSSFNNGDVVTVRAMDVDGCYGTSTPITLIVNQVSGLWTGSKNSEWDEPANWCNGSVPAQNTSLTITAVTNAPEMGGTWETENLTVAEGAVLDILPGSKIDVGGDLFVHNTGKMVLHSNSGANGLASLITHGAVDGKTHVELTVPTNQWYYLSSTMKDIDYSHFGVNNDGARVYAYRNKSWAKYSTPAASSALTDLEGILTIFDSTDPLVTESVIKYSGNINTEPIARDLGSRGFFLFGNPYSASLDWQDDNNKWPREGIYGTIWYRTRVNKQMTFITYNRVAPENGRVAVYPDNTPMWSEKEMALIPPYQSAWVFADVSGVTLRVDPKQRVHGVEGGTLKSSKRNDKADILRVMVENESSRDGAVIYFSENSTNAFDPGDSPKYFNSSVEIPEVYTRSAGQALAISGMAPFEGSFDLPMSVRNRVKGTVDLNFDLSYYSSDDVILLHDTYLDTEINLRKVPQYRYEPFNLGDSHDRFVIRFNPEGYEDVTTPVIENNSTDSSEHLINITGANGRAIVSIDRELLQIRAGEIQIFNVAGAKISEFKATTNKTFIVLPETPGVYLVVVKAGGKMKSKKLVR